jgi:hypothetical protein
MTDRTDYPVPTLARLARRGAFEYAELARQLDDRVEVHERACIRREERCVDVDRETIQSLGLNPAEWDVDWMQLVVRRKVRPHA